MPQNSTPPPDDPEQGMSFLSRWSARKVKAAADAEAPQVEPEPEAGMALPAEGQPTGDEGTATDAPPRVTEADLENLTYESDYTKFMGNEVPDALRRRALRTLWRSDPVLANLDGLCDYDDDFTDAALAVKVLETAHRVGQGHLSDDDLTANRARGEPPPAAAGDIENSDAFDQDDSVDVAETEDDAGEPDVAETATNEDGSGEDKTSTPS